MFLKLSMFSVHRVYIAIYILFSFTVIVYIGVEYLQLIYFQFVSRNQFEFLHGYN